jgi:ATP-dependent protease HslVU (ClpYQ) ATPase subunit
VSDKLLAEEKERKNNNNNNNNKKRSKHNMSHKLRLGDITSGLIYVELSSLDSQPFLIFA